MKVSNLHSLFTTKLSIPIFLRKSNIDKTLFQEIEKKKHKKIKFLFSKKSLQSHCHSKKIEEIQ